MLLGDSDFRFFSLKIDETAKTILLKLTGNNNWGQDRDVFQSNYRGRVLIAKSEKENLLKKFGKETLNSPDK